MDLGQYPGDEQGHRQGQQYDDILPHRLVEGNPGDDTQSGSHEHAHIVQQQPIGLFIYDRNHGHGSQKEHLYEHIEEYILHVSADQG